MCACFVKYNRQLFRGYAIVLQGYVEMSIEWRYILNVWMHIRFKLSKLWLVCSIVFYVFVCTVESRYLELR